MTAFAAATALEPACFKPAGPSQQKGRNTPWAGQRPDSDGDGVKEREGKRLDEDEGGRRGWQRESRAIAGDSRPLRQRMRRGGPEDGKRHRGALDERPLA